MSKRSPSGSRRPASKSPPADLPIRLAITLLAPCSLAILHAIGLPGVDTSGLPASDAVARGSFSAFGLGVIPFLGAAAIVELVAALVPRWSALRLGGPEGRATLARATAFLGIVLAGFQAWGIAALLSSTGIRSVVGPSEPWLIVVTLVAGSSCLVLLASLAGARALAGGIALVATGGPLLTTLAGLVRGAQGPSLIPLFGLSLELVGIVAVTAVALRPPRALAPAPAPADVDQASPYRAPATTPGLSRGVIPSPASGVTPVALTAGILAFVPRVAGPSGPMKRLATELTADLVFLPVAATLLALFTVALGWLFNQPARIAALRLHVDHAERGYAELLDEARAELFPAITRALLFVGALFFLEQLATRLAGASLPSTPIALGAALAIDVLAELRARRATPDLVPVWPEHRPYAIAVAREALEASGIPLHARGERLRRMLQFFGSYAPIELMVPRADARRATKILAEVLLLRPEDARSSASPGFRPPTTPSMIASALRSGSGAALALLFVGFAIIGLLNFTPHPDARSPAPARADTLQILPVDDDLTLADFSTEPLPRGASWQEENAPLGPDRTASRRYVRLVLGEAESMAQARARLEEWVSRVPVPEGERALVSKFFEASDDSDHPTYEEAGWRTYLVKGPATITGSDVDSAVAAPGADGLTAHVSLELTRAAGARFAALTKASVKRRLAIVVDHEVMSAPVIQGEIPGGHVQISMGVGPLDQQLAEARRLAAKLRGD